MTEMQSESFEVDLARREQSDVMALLHQLEASLLSGQTALLRRDLNGLKRIADEQKALYHALLALPEVFANLTLGGEPNRTAQLQEAQARILRIGRLQAKLLARAQRALTVSANLMAGAGSNYGPARMHFGPIKRSFSDASEG
jgi:hypothetical protein